MGKISYLCFEDAEEAVLGEYGAKNWLPGIWFELVLWDGRPVGMERVLVSPRGPKGPPV